MNAQTTQRLLLYALSDIRAYMSRRVLSKTRWLRQAVFVLVELDLDPALRGWKC